MSALSVFVSPFLSCDLVPTQKHICPSSIKSRAEIPALPSLELGEMKKKSSRAGNEGKMGQRDSKINGQGN